jgi:beta-mannosidase
VKKASETIHVQLNEANYGVEVVNNTPEPLTALSLHTTEYTLDGKVTTEDTKPVASVPASTTLKAYQFVPETRQALYFVKLDLTDASGKLLSTNFYWQNVAQEDFTGLDKLPTVTLNAEASSRIVGDNTHIKVTLHNPSQSIALMTHLQLHQKQSGKRVLPAFYSDNYVTLVPNESRTLTIEAATKDLANESPLVAIDGYNIESKPTNGEVTIAPNLNAQPLHWPASSLVPHP